MTRDQLVQLVENWQERLGLKLWHIEIKWDPAQFTGDPAPHARVWRSRNYNEATLRLNPHTCEEWDFPFAERTIVHELLHLIERDLDTAVGRLKAQVPDEDMRAVVSDVYDDAAEAYLDFVANRIVDIFHEGAS